MEGRAGEEKKVNGKSKNLKYINKITMYGEKSKKKVDNKRKARSEMGVSSRS